MTPLDFSGLGFVPGEVAVVTGAANGIGKSTALMLVRSGLTVAAWDLDEPALRRLADEAGPAAVPVVCDLSDGASVSSAWDATDAIGHPVRYLVNNAGPDSTMAYSAAEGAGLAIAMYTVVTEGFVSRHPDEASSISFTASLAGNFKGGVSEDWYPTAKAGIAGYMRHIAVKFRGRPRSNGVAPGRIHTERIAATANSDEARERIRTNPLGRAGAPDEVAAVICFLLSPASSYVNGVLIPIDGAWYCAG